MEFMEHIPQADPSAPTPCENPVDLARRVFGSNLKAHRKLSKYSVIGKELTKAQKQRIENLCPASFHGQERPLLLRINLLITDEAIYHKPGPGKHSIRIAHRDVLMIYSAVDDTTLNFGKLGFEPPIEAVGVDSTKREIPRMESPRGTLFFLEQLRTNATGERAFMTVEFQREYQNSSHAMDILGQIKNGESPDTIVDTMIDTHHQSDDVVYAWLDTMTELLDSNSGLKAMLMMIGGFALAFVMALIYLFKYDSASDGGSAIPIIPMIAGVLISVGGLWSFLTATRKPEHLLARWRKTWVDIAGWEETVPLAAVANGQTVPDSAKKPGLSLSQIQDDNPTPPARASSVLKGIFVGGIPTAILVATIAAIMSANGYQFFKDKSGTPLLMAMLGGVVGAIVGALIGAIIQAISQKTPAVEDLTARFEVKE